MKRGLLLILMLVFVSAWSFAKDYKLSSPDGKIVLTVSVGTDIKWSVSFDGKEAISSVKAGMVLSNGKILGQNEFAFRSGASIRFKHLKKSVKSGDKMKIEMAPGGGWVARISSN